MTAAKVAAHGVVGGLSSQAQRGNFSSGFWSAGLSQAAGQYGIYDQLGAHENAVGWGIAQNAGISAAVGGIISEMTGGTFEQGALNASMGRLFNDVAHAGMIGTLPASVAIGEALSALGGYVAAGAESLGVVLGGISVAPVILVGVVVWTNDTGPEDPGYSHLESPSRGSTGRTDSANLEEQLAIQEARSNPQLGRELDIEMKDRRWPTSEGWRKYHQKVYDIPIHYVGNFNTEKFDDFKFKK